MILLFVEHHPTLQAILKPFHGDNLDIPLRRKSVFFTLGIARNKMRDTLGQILAKLRPVLCGVVVYLGSKGHCKQVSV